MADVNSSRRDYWTLALIVIGASLLRLVGLARESFWSDETFSAYAATFSNPSGVIDYARADVHPPGFFLTLWGWTRLFGDGEYEIRLLAAIGGILMVPVMFRLGRQLFNPQTGLLAAFLSAFLIQSVVFSQEARAYSWMATLGALSVSLALDCRKGGVVRSAFFLAVTTIALAYLHYFGLILAFLVWIALLVYPGNARRVWTLAGSAALAAAYLPWLPYLLEQRGRVNWIPVPNLRYVTELFNVYYGPGLPVDVWIALFLAAGIPLALGKGTLRLKSPENFLLLWILVPLVLALLVSAIVRPVYSPRNMLISSGAATLLLARAVTEIGERIRNMWIPAIALVLGMYAVHFATGRGYFVKPTKQQLREASRFVMDRNSHGLPVYTIGWDKINFDYYFRQAGWNGELRTVSEADVDSKGLAKSIPEEEFWIASAGIDVNLHENLRHDFQVLESGEFLLARAYRLRRKQP